MTDMDLQRRLRELNIPAVEESARAKALARAQSALSNSVPSNAVALPRGDSWPATGWRIGLGFACVLAVVLGLGRICLPRSADNELDPKVLSEVEALFPGQVDAVVRSGADLSISLSDLPISPCSSQRVSVTMRRGGQTIQALAYSGREFCLKLGRVRECMEPLVTGEGKVILSGKKFAWSEGNPSPIEGYSVSAHPLPL